MSLVLVKNSSTLAAWKLQVLPLMGITKPYGFPRASICRPWFMFVKKGRQLFLNRPGAEHGPKDFSIPFTSQILVLRGLTKVKFPR
jgi:hypothetical protein